MMARHSAHPRCLGHGRQHRCAASTTSVAARRAAEAFAYGEAARHRERALVVQELADTDDIAERCDLLVALSKALFPAGATERVIEQTAPEALQLALTSNSGTWTSAEGATPQPAGWPTAAV